MSSTVLRPVSLRTIAREAGVSITTASRVLNGGKTASQIGAECAERVRRVADRLGYTPNYHARSMRLGRAETIGVAIDVADPSDRGMQLDSIVDVPYFSAMLAGIEAHLRSVGYRMLTLGGDLQLRAPDRGLADLRQRRIDGLLVFGRLVDSEQTQFLYERQPFPVVILDPKQATPWPSVSSDEAAGMRVAVDHLASLGHRTLMMLHPPDYDRTGQVRRQRFVSSTWDAGATGSAMEFDFDVVAAGARGRDVAMAAGAREAMRRRLGGVGLGGATAIVCYNDATALGALQSLQAAGVRVPEDVSLIGFDNTHSRLTHPAITSVDLQFVEVGRRAASRVLGQIAKEDDAAASATPESVPPQLVIRASTGPAKIA